MNRLAIFLAILGFVDSSNGQVLRISSSSGDDAANSEIVVALEADGKKAPVAVQFDLLIPARQFALEQWSYSASAAAKSTGKSAQCGGRWGKGAGVYIYTCVISGQTSEIQDGPIFQATLARLNDAKRHGGKIILEGAQAVDAEGKQHSIKKTEWAYH
jgi:hypothetical protein